MRAVTYNGRRDVRVEEVPDPKVEAPEDAILRITTSGICPVDVELYYRRGLDFIHLGTVLGHEYVGVVEEAGRGVSRIRKGDRVIGSPYPACGACPECREKLTSHCRRSGRAALGSTLSGAHAQFMRVPFADQTLERVPPDLTDEQVICVGDAFSTAFHHASIGGDLTGKPAAVLGLGLAGLLGVLALRTLGADPVIAVDVIPGRLERAERLGAEPLDAGTERVGRVLRDRTEGRGVAYLLDTAADAMGLSLGIGGLRAGGTLVLGGTYAEEQIPLPAAAWWKGLRMFAGVASTREWNRLALQWISAGKIDLASFVTDTLALEDAPGGFLRLDRSPLNGFTENYNPVAESCLKVILKP